MTDGEEICRTDVRGRIKMYACYVIYNDAKLFRMSLYSIIDYVDKVVVVDGAWSSYPYGDHPESTDDPKSIAEQICGDKLIWVDCQKLNGRYIPWNNELEKRNEYLKRIPDDEFFLIIDSDTMLFGEMEKEFRKIKENDFHISLIPEVLHVPYNPNRRLIDDGFGGLKDPSNKDSQEILRENITEENWKVTVQTAFIGHAVAIYKKVKGMEYRVHHSLIWVGTQKVFDLYGTVKSKPKEGNVPAKCNYILEGVTMENFSYMRPFKRWRENMIDKSEENRERSKYHPIIAPILICTPFNNESHAIDLYVKSLLDLDYPKDLIDLVWLENDSVDNTWNILTKYYREINAKYHYHSFNIIRRGYGLKRLGKLSQEQFENGNCGFRCGKNIISNPSDASDRAKRLCDIYHYFFGLLDKDYHKYFLMFMADALPPANAIKRFIEVYEIKGDAGWVGGVHHKRYPFHIQTKLTDDPDLYGLAAPLFKNRPNERIYGTPSRTSTVYYVSDAELLRLTIKDPIIECEMTGHFFMIKPDVIFAGARMKLSGYDIIQSCIDKIYDMNLKVYCATDIYLEHISLDGKIYRHNVREGVLNLQKEIKLFSESEQAEREEYMRFKHEYEMQCAEIPARPSHRGEIIIDPVTHERLDDAAWDKRFGRWKKYFKK
jgi:hypothetical protein